MICECPGFGERFCDEHHRYWREDLLLPSVTTIIEGTLPRTGDASEDAIYNAGLRGSFVDKAVAEYLTTGEVSLYKPDGIEEKYWERWKTAVRYAIEWFDKERKGALIECQVRLYGSREAGTMDFLVDKREIIDLKATYEMDHEKMPLQVTGYADLYLTMGNENTPVPKIAILHVNARFAKAQYREYDYREVYPYWANIREYWRMLSDRKTFKPVVQARPQAEKVLPDKRVSSLQSVS